MSTYLTDEDKAGLFEKAMLCDHPNCELCREAIPFIEELIRRHRKEAWNEGWRDCAQVGPDDVVIGSNPYDQEKETT